MKQSRRHIDINLNELDQVLDHARAGPLSQSDYEKLRMALHTLAELVAGIAAHGVFNLMLSDGSALFAHCSTKLCYVVRRYPFDTARLADEDLSVDFSQLTTPNDVDLYCLRLLTVPPAGQPIVQLNCVVNNGPNVYLFDAIGKGVFVDETCLGGQKTIVAPNVSLTPGTYYVGVAYGGLAAQSLGGAIWLAGFPGQRAPDGAGGAQALIGWAGAPIAAPLNPYHITLAFMGFCDGAVPTRRQTWGALKQHYR